MSEQINTSRSKKTGNPVKRTNKPVKKTFQKNKNPGRAEKNQVIEVVEYSSDLTEFNQEKILSDKSSAINILFIDVEKDWRGGHSQLAYLLEQLLERHCNIYLVCRDGGALWSWAERMGRFCLVDYRVSPSFLYGLNKLIKDDKIQIIHAQSSRSHDVALIMKLLNPEVRLIVSRRVDFHRRRGFYNKWKYHTHLIDLWIAVSNNVKNVLINDGVDSERIRVINDGVDTGLWKKSVEILPFEDRRRLTRESLNYQIREINKERRFKKDVVKIAFQGVTSVQHHETNPEFIINDDDFLFGVVAALVDHKDHETLLRAFSIIVNEKSSFKLLIVGDGKLWVKLEKLIDELGLHSNVHMLGFRTDVDDLMKLFDGYVLSSYMDGLGSSLIDAMAAGLPIVCTDAGGFPEIIKNGRNGIMVPKKNPGALAEAMIQLSNNKKLRKEMSKNNIKDARKFDVGIMTSQTWETYTKLIQESL